jgi:Flp pilus assembly pilin Flp
VERAYVYLARFLGSEAGEDLVEYALVTVFVSVAVVLAAAATGLVPAFGVWADNLAGCVGSSNPLNC